MNRLLFLCMLFFCCQSPNEPPPFTKTLIEFVSYSQTANNKGIITITVTGTTHTGYSIEISTKSTSQISKTFFLPKNAPLKIRFNTSKAPDTLYIKAQNDLTGSNMSVFLYEYQYQ